MAAKRLSPAQWTVVDAYANFSSAALAVYTTRPVAALTTVVSAQSKVTAMFTRDLASATDPEALYSTVTVESVAIHWMPSQPHLGAALSRRAKPALRVVVGAAI